MATELEVKWMNLIAPMKPRFIESEGVWCVAYDNEFDREIERFPTKELAVSFCNSLAAPPGSLSLKSKQRELGANTL